MVMYWWSKGSQQFHHPLLTYLVFLLLPCRSSFITAEGEVGHCKEVERLCVALLNKFTVNCDL